MAIKTIMPDELKINEPVKWHIYDGSGRLLIKEGMKLRSQSQIDKLIALEAFYRIIEEEADNTEIIEGAINTALSPFEQIEELLDNMERLFETIVHEPAHSRKKLPEKLEELGDSVISLCEYDVDAVIGAIHIDQKHCYAIKHPLHCAVLSYVLAMKKGIQNRLLNTLVCAAITSNIGMFELQRGELMRHRGPLTALQRDKVEKHTMRSSVLLKRIGVKNKLWHEIVLQHHEKADGTGYPRTLAGKKFIIEARILGLVDRYGAMVAPREYRQAMAPTKALQQLFKERGPEVDAKLGALLIKEMGIYPPGASVVLANKEVAIVTRRGEDRMKPIVKSIYSFEGGKRYPKPITHDSEVQMHRIMGLVELPGDYVVDLYELWDYTH